MSKTSTAQKILKLKEEIASLERQFTPAEDPEEIVKTHIDLMHRYNDYKDAGQVLIGKIATLESTTASNIYERLGLSHED